MTDWEYYKKKYPTAEAQKSFESQIINGESYNYGNKNDEEHDLLDSKSTKNDYSLRKNIKKSWDESKDDREYDWTKIDNEKDDYSEKQK
ncbi:DUF3114 domain-containing protein [Enterococcus sp. AZ007]|uniref:DUF3114 domain-containing protein n=1 Tax=Enterococcus sp. AZ007 TaxID=2774839 RepID=UPI003F6945C0